MDLSLRLSHVDPEAAKKARKKQEKAKKKQTTTQSGEGDSADEGHSGEELDIVQSR